MVEKFRELNDMRHWELVINFCSHCYSQNHRKDQTNFGVINTCLLRWKKKKKKTKQRDSFRWTVSCPGPEPVPPSRFSPAVPWVSEIEKKGGFRGGFCGRIPGSMINLVKAEKISLGMMRPAVLSIPLDSRYTE